MQRWKEEFVGNAHKKCVQINRNGVFDQGKVLYMEPDWDCLDLLNAASQRLELVPAAERIFNADGTEIDDCMMIVDDDILFFSKDQDFIQPESTHPENADQAGRSEGERLPNSAGGYKVGELLGRGGFGEVRLGEHQLTGERVALKFLRKVEIQSLGAAERTNTEIQCLATLKHMNIIRLMQHLETANHVILVFELMEGGDLLKFLLRRGGLLSTPAIAAKTNNNAPVAAAIVSNQNNTDDMAQAGGERLPSKCTLTEDEARHVFYQVVSSISYAHNQHICHRDLKLENILLKDATLSLVKIADFGLSDFYRPGATMKSSCGTLSFLAPEVFKGTSNAGPPLDVWSLGVILFAMLCGRLPFEGPDLIGTKRPREQIIKSRIMKCQYKIDEHLGPEAKDLVKRMLQVDPSERASIPEIFNHVWMRSAVSGSLAEAFQFQNISSCVATRSTSDTTMPFPPVGSNFGTPNTKETAVRSLNLSPEPSTPNGTREKEVMSPLERSESMPHTEVKKLGRHRSSQSMNGINLSGIPVGRSNSSISSTKSLMSSTNDLLAMEAQAIAAEQQLHLQGSPPGSAPADLYTSKAAAHARLILSPSKDNLSLMEMRQQGSFSSSEFSCLDPTTPCGNTWNLSPSPYSIMEEGSTTPSTVTNKAFKLVPQRRQQSNDSAGGSEYNSPSAKLRSYSTSDASSLHAAAASAIGGSAARPITGRRAGPAFGDYDDDDDSYSTGNWRNITLDPSPSTGNLPASGTSTSRKITNSVSTSSGLNSANTSMKGPRRESLAPSRGSSSSSLGAGTGSNSTSNANAIEQTPTRKSMSTSQASVGRSAVSVLSSAAAAVASLALSGSPRDDSAPGGGLFPKPHAGHGHSSFTPSAAASSSGIAAITPVAHDMKRNV